jgi:hypothetical protein
MADAAAKQRRNVRALHDPAFARARAKAARMIHERRQAELYPPLKETQSPDAALAHSARGETPRRPAAHSSRQQTAPAPKKYDSISSSDYGRAIRELVEHQQPSTSAKNSQADLHRLHEGVSHATCLKHCAA